MSVFHPLLALGWNPMPHLCIRKIIGKHILAGEGHNLIQDVPWGLHLFICALKKNNSYFVFLSGVGAWDNFISSNLFTVFLFERPEPADINVRVKI